MGFSLRLAEVLESPVVQGYVEILQRVGRSQENPPTVPALIRNQHRGSPHINSIIDIYNVGAPHFYWLLVGMIDKIDGW